MKALTIATGISEVLLLVGLAFGQTTLPVPALAQPSQLRTCSGFFATNFVAKSCVSFVAL